MPSTLGPPAGPSEKLKSLKLENPDYISNPQSVYVNTKTKEVSYQNVDNGGKRGAEYQSLGPSQQKSQAYEELGRNQNPKYEELGGSRNPQQYEELGQNKNAKDYEALGDSSNQKSYDVIGGSQGQDSYDVIPAAQRTEEATYTALEDEGAYYKLWKWRMFIVKFPLWHIHLKWFSGT